MDNKTNLYYQVKSGSGTNSARSYTVSIYNNSDSVLKVAGSSNSSGQWSDNGAPTEIGIGTWGSFTCESHGFCTGAEGSVVYKIDKLTPTDPTTVTFNFAVPYWGSNSASWTVDRAGSGYYFDPATSPNDGKSGIDNASDSVTFGGASPSPGGTYGGNID
ncbi:hypothetical protein AB1286_03655 [Trinickia sp. NRRL B-1857]|uniref:hypothetical protein n=1 Tax=Trinickia sp. NRRL B-1857 TaxID=3162879 RepID=UPI003D293C9A